MIVEIILFLVALYFASLFYSEKNLPPGPWKIPVLGSGLPIRTLEQCLKMREKYGDVFRIKLGVMNFVYITDFKLAREALSTLELANRPKWPLFRLFEEEKENEACGGVIMSNGQRWHQTRRFLLRNLRDLGMGKSKTEDVILGEVEALVEDFKAITGQPSRLPFSINICVLNVIWQLVASHRYDFNDSDVEKLMETVNKVHEGFMVMGIPDFFPFLRYIFPEQVLDHVLGKEAILEATRRYEDLVQPYIADHLAKLDPSNIADLMDEYLLEMKEKKSKDFAHFSISDLIRTTFDLFIAGNDTTANMTMWTLFYMAKFRDFQEIIQAEIDNVVPRDRIPGLQHREGLAIVDAVINEVQRVTSMILFGVMRATSAEINIGGYTIPKNFVIISAAGVTHMDRKYWEEPETFNPGRFLDENGRFIPSVEGFQPFGLGKRQCLGEAFARMELFLIISALLQNFTFAPPDGEDIDLTPNDKLQHQLHIPKKEQKFSIKLRK